MAERRGRKDVINTPVGDIEVEKNKIIGRPNPTELEKKKMAKDVHEESYQIRNHKGILITKIFEVGRTGSSIYKKLIKIKKGEQSK